MTTPSTPDELVAALTRDPNAKLGNTVAARRAIEAFADLIADRARWHTLQWAAAHAELRSTHWKQADNCEATAALSALGVEFGLDASLVAAREAQRISAKTSAAGLGMLPTRKGAARGAAGLPGGANSPHRLVVR